MKHNSVTNAEYTLVHKDTEKQQAKMFPNRKEVTVMYENEIYSERNGAPRQGDSSVNCGSTGTNTANEYFDYTTCSAEDLKQKTGSYDRNAVKAAKRAVKAAKKAGKIPMGTPKKFVLSVSLGLCFGLFAGAGFYAVQFGAAQLFPTKTESSAETTELPEDISAFPVNGNVVTSHVTYVQDDISEMVEEVMPAMVSIVNNYTTTGMNFWGQTYSQPGVSSGSGIIIGETEKELLIATNNHVVESAQSLEITFIDESKAEAVVKGTDSDMDLAVIAVPVSGLTEDTLNTIAVANLGDSDNLKLGEPVVAIGNALGYGQSVTNGIISALNREMTTEDGATGTYIQTNAAINHGNSGGALLNINGEVIGINAAKIDGSTVEGMGYAIPISAASPIISELMQRETRTEKVAEEEIGYMGITMQAITDQIATAFDMPKGVFVKEIEEGSAAEAAGIKKGDIIVKFDGTRISSSTDLQDTLQYFRAGETAVVTVKRAENGEYKAYDLEITLGKRPASQN